MREFAELRVDETFALMVFAEGQGKRLGHGVREIVIETKDPRFARVGRLQQELLASKGQPFYFGWTLRRHYGPAELAAASCFQLYLSTYFGPAGEECGTVYDDTAACRGCGSGGVQRSALHLDFRKLPRRAHIGTTIADEWIVSQHLAERLIDAKLTGFELREVRDDTRYDEDPVDLRRAPAGHELLRRAEAADLSTSSFAFMVWLHRAENAELWAQVKAAQPPRTKGARRGRAFPTWYQFIVTSATAEIVPPTRLGSDPFNDAINIDQRCSMGDLIGGNLLSEVSILAASRGTADIFRSRQFVGERRGMMRPRRITFISTAFHALLRAEKVFGAEIEIVHLV